MDSKVPDKDLKERLENMSIDELHDYAELLMDERPWTLVTYSVHHARFVRTQSHKALHNAIGIAQTVVQVTPADDETRSQIAEETSALMKERFMRKSIGNDLAGAIYWIKEAIRMTPANDSRLILRTQLLADLDSLKDQYLNAPAEKEDELEPVANILKALDKIRLSFREDADSLDDIMEVQARLHGARPNSVGRLALLCSYRNMLERIYTETKTEENLNQVINAAAEASKAMAEFQSTEASEAEMKLYRAQALYYLGELVAERCVLNHNRDVDDLTYGIQCLELASEGLVELSSLALCLNGLFGLLGDRYLRTGHMGDIRRAALVGERALEIVRSDESLDRAMYLNNLANTLRVLHEATNDVQVLDRSIALSEEALKLLPLDSPKRFKYEAERAAVLSRTYESTANIALIDEGIQICDGLLLNATETNTSGGEFWNILTGLLRHRYDRTEVKEDIYRSVDSARKAVTSTSTQDPYHPDRLANLATVLWRKFDREGERGDLDEAIEVAHLAVQNTPDGSAWKATHLSTMAGLLTARYKLIKSDEDIDNAVTFATMGVEASSPGKLSYSMNRNNLARTLFLRSSNIKDSSFEDLAKAVGIMKSIISDTLDSDARLAIRLSNLGHMLIAKYKKTSEATDLHEAVDAFRKCSNMSFAAPSLRILAAREAANLLISQSHFGEANIFLQKGVKLLRQVSPRSLHQKDQQHLISQFAGLATLAASTALQAGANPGEALSILEEGRGVILGLLFDIRSDVSTLRSQHPDLANKFEELRDELDSPDARDDFSDRVGGVSLDLTRRDRLSKELDDIITTIRGQEGYHNFLGPPPIIELKAAASAGPIVVINVSPHRSDALIVTSQQVSLLPLPQLGLKEVQVWVNLVKSRTITQLKMFELLGWLWDSLALPVLDSLAEQKQSTMSLHVWWIPTGPLCSLPIHASGRYRQISSSSNTLLSRVLSSYSSSIKVMLFAQRNKVHWNNVESPQRSLIVSMATTPGQSGLLSADEEAEAVRKELLRLMTKGDIPPVLMRPNKADVLMDLKSATILHFAGHGESDPMDPLNSKLLVQDWQNNPLTVKDLLALKLHERPLFLAYLSACSTGSNKVEHLLDEGLHLMSACQLIGFQHIIGSLWEISDSHSVRVAQKVFAEIVNAEMDDNSVSRGLQEGLKSLRDHKAPGALRQGHDPAQLITKQTWDGGDPRIWAAYIHMGL